MIVFGGTTMTAHFSIAFALFERSVFISAERFCDAKMNSGSMPNALRAE